MSNVKSTQYSQGDMSPVEYMSNKKKSNKVYGFILGVLVIMLACVAAIL
tara:strand:+ start:535 stop:681 length:147 start_codon:yes stop_codon:yes gene_type:complete